MKFSDLVIVTCYLKLVDLIILSKLESTTATHFLKERASFQRRNTQG